MKTAKEIWLSRNPQHETNLDTGTDDFWVTMEMCMEEYAKLYAQSIKGEWVDVKERLPEQNLVVICGNIKDNWVVAGQINDDGLWYNQFEDGFSDSEIFPTHWMKIPELPTLSGSK